MRRCGCGCSCKIQAVRCKCLERAKKKACSSTPSTLHSTAADTAWALSVRVRAILSLYTAHEQRDHVCSAGTMPSEVSEVSTQSPTRAAPLAACSRERSLPIALRHRDAPLRDPVYAQRRAPRWALLVGLDGVGGAAGAYASAVSQGARGGIVQWLGGQGY